MYIKIGMYIINIKNNYLLFKLKTYLNYLNYTNYFYEQAKNLKS